MFKFLLLIVVLNSDQSKYTEFVESGFQTVQECREKKAAVMSDIKIHFPGDFVFYADCVQPRALSAIEV